MAQGNFVADCLKLYKLAPGTEGAPSPTNLHGQEWRRGGSPKEIQNAITVKEREWVTDNKVVSTTGTKYIKSEITSAWLTGKEQHGLTTLVWEQKA